MIYDFDFDKDGNIIILDYNRMWKFSRNGRFIKKWSRAGEGPGEFRNPFSFYILNDTIHVVNSPKIKKFDNTGKFINDIKVINYSDFPNRIIAACEKYLIGTKTGFDTDTFMKTDRILMYDPKTLKLKKTLFERTRKKKGSMFSRDDYFLFTGGEKEFFVVDNSYDDYKIDCYDSKTGKMKYKIRKNHIRVKNDEKIKKHFGTDSKGNKLIVTTGDEKLKESINWVYFDKYGRLWVDSNNIDKEEKEEGGLYFDIFKDGVFLKRIKLDIEIYKAWGFKLNGNKIVVSDEDNNVNVYEFK